MATMEDRVRMIDSEPSLFEFLQDELRWPSDEPTTYQFDADELGLTDDEAKQIKAVRQIAPFQTDQPWGIFLVEFQSAKSYQGILRRVLRGLSETRRDRDPSMPAWTARNLLFICTSDFREFSFARFEGQTHTRAPLSIFGWDAGGSGLRTLCEFNLPALRYPLPGTSPDDWLKHWAEAWNVEKVTEKFYREYEIIFNQVEAMITGVKGDKRLFTQRLFNRLMFIQFLSKKRWLRFGNDKGGTNYLPALWEGRDKSFGFYSAHICPLFFSALNNPHIDRDLGTDTVLASRIGKVPYLNGGLFQQFDDERCGEDIPDEAFDLIINQLLARFNFTVHESTPLEIEVAVDPEMLGKVFEELVNDRHKSGSYYTPRPVVSFMCKEALKGYLGEFETLIDRHNAPNASVKEVQNLLAAISVPQAKALLQKLADVKVVDPACGSGAYLLGMLQELFTLNRLLDTRADQATARDDYKRKLAIIRTNIYGVDIDDFAVQIARLRLWLSLAVEFDGDVPEPLPNLDFKVEQGDSLSAPSPQETLTADMYRQHDIREFSTKKAQYADPYYTQDKTTLKRDIIAIREKITLGMGRTQRVTGFDWQVEFAEVFEPKIPVADIGGAMNFGGTLAEAPSLGGFDIVLANPPYVRMELFKGQKATLKNNFPNVHAERADLYCYFYERALQILCSGGMLVFISPNKWFRAGYGAGLRKFIARTCNILKIVDFGELPVFQTAATFPMIFIAQKGVTGKHLTTFTQVQSLSPPYPDVLKLVHAHGKQLPIDPLGDLWTFSAQDTYNRLVIMEKNGTPLIRYVNGGIYRGIVTGLNKAFYINEKDRDHLLSISTNNSHIIKPLIYGDCTRRWRIDNERNRWVLYIHDGIDMNAYPSLLQHMEPFRESLLKRAGKQEWYELQQPQLKFERYYKSRKIVFPDICKESRFVLDTQGHYLDATTTCLASDDEFLLGVLNSSSVWAYLSEKCAILGDADKGGRLRLKTFYVENIPVPNASDTDRAVISALVKQCLDAKGVDCYKWEREIDERVAALYGL